MCALARFCVHVHVLVDMIDSCEDMCNCIQWAYALRCLYCSYVHDFVVISSHDHNNVNVHCGCIINRFYVNRCLFVCMYHWMYLNISIFVFMFLYVFEKICDLCLYL